jgi:hypothetical protein
MKRRPVAETRLRAASIADGTRDAPHSHAVVLREVLEEKRQK